MARVPATKLHGLTLWNSDDVREWQKGRDERKK